MLYDTKVLIADIENRAAKAEISISELSSRANIARSTFQRWKSGHNEPTLGALRRMVEVLELEENKKKDSGLS